MIAQRINTLLQSWFSFPENKLFCQVSTLNGDQPCIRTMDLYDFTREGSLIFLTNTQSGKWYHLTKLSKIAVCLLNVDGGQIIVEGSTLLHTNATNPLLAAHYWENYLDEYWRNFYWSYTPDSVSSQKEIPASFGVIEIYPKSWDILEIKRGDFLKSSREKFQLQDNKWVMTKLPIE